LDAKVHAGSLEVWQEAFPPALVNLHLIMNIRGHNPVGQGLNHNVEVSNFQVGEVLVSFDAVKLSKAEDSEKPFFVGDDLEMSTSQWQKF
jgi:hypothetical protein